MSYTTGSHTHGEDHYAAKVNEEIVREIRRLYKDGVKMAEIARQARLCYSTVKAICSGQTWRHVKDTTVIIPATPPKKHVSRCKTGKYEYRKPSKERAELGKKFTELHKNGDSLARIARENGGISKWTVVHYMNDYQKQAGVANASSS